jgi:hypothetical protein
VVGLGVRNGNMGPQLGLSLYSLPSVHDLALCKVFYFKMYFIECPGSSTRQSTILSSVS